MGGEGPTDGLQLEGTSGVYVINSFSVPLTKDNDNVLACFISRLCIWNQLKMPFNKIFGWAWENVSMSCAIAYLESLSVTKKNAYNFNARLQSLEQSWSTKTYHYQNFSTLTSKIITSTATCLKKVTKYVITTQTVNISWFHYLKDFFIYFNIFQCFCSKNCYICFFRHKLYSWYFFIQNYCDILKRNKIYDQINCFEFRPQGSLWVRREHENYRSKPESCLGQVFT